jgi:hypothetical protein
MYSNYNQHLKIIFMTSMKIGFFKRYSVALMALFVGASFLVTGCFCESGKCYPPGGAHKKVNDKKRELMASNANVVSEKTGMLYSFGEEKNNEQNTTAVYKDLSMHYVPLDESCPFAPGSKHTYFTAGPNMNFKSAGDDVYAEGSHKPRLGFQAGFRVQYQVNEKLALVPGLLYKQNNAREQATIYDGEPGGGDPGITIKDDYSFSYLSAPILGQYNFTDHLSVSAGPEVNYLLNAKVKTESTYGGGDPGRNTENITDDMVKLGLGVQLGVKYDIPDSRWSLELIYDHRLSRLNKKPDMYETPAWRMKSIQLGVKSRICDLVKGPKHQNAK